MSYISDILKVIELGEKYVPKVVKLLTPPNNERSSWENYDKLFDIEGYKIPYISILNNWQYNIKEYNRSFLETKSLDVEFKLSESIGNRNILEGAYNGRRCRLAHFNVSSDKKLFFTFQETSYYDYLNSGEHLDSPYPVNDKITNREAFGDKLNEHKGSVFPFEYLTNICGTGVFVLTTDNYLIISSHSKNSHVYPGRYSFTSSGLMEWGNAPNPVDEVLKKCFAETNHKLNEDLISLIGFGADARKLFFQYSFLERSKLSFKEIADKHKQGSRNKNSSNLIGLKFNLKNIINKLIGNCWEPAAEAALLTVCALMKSNEEVMRELFSMRSQWEKKKMLDEWDYRASKPGLLPIMSVRYKEKQLQKLSGEYINKVMGFIRNDIHEKDIVEIGSGIGRLTANLVKSAKKVTCVEFCEKMLKKSLDSLGENSEIVYIPMFAQDYHPPYVHDVAICSLVLIHNTSDVEYENLIENMCRIANKVFVFEDVKKRFTSKRTKIRTREDICVEFNRHNFDLSKMESHLLDKDNIAFLEFKRIE